MTSSLAREERGPPPLLRSSSGGQLDPGKLREIQERCLQLTLEAVAVAHPFYRERFRTEGVDLSTIPSLDDLQGLPLTSKQDYMADPEAFRLRSEDLPASAAAEERVLWDVAYTTGTSSGRPSPFYNTTHDFYGILDQARRCNEAEGLLPSDRVANLYPLAGFPTGAFLSVVRSTMIAGLPVVHALTGAANSEFKVRNSLSEALDKVAALRPTVLWGVPSFVRRFLDHAVEQRADLRDVRMVITSGERVPPALRGELRLQLAELGARAVEFRARYAFTEMQGGLVQCTEAAPVQNVCPDLYFLEVVDPQTAKRLPHGETGMLAITHLHRRGTVLLRYLVGDIVALSRDACPHCGRVGERVITPPRRTGSLVKCRGMLVNTDVVVELLSALAEVSDFQIVFARDDRAGAMDRMLIRVELASERAAAGPIASASSDDVRETIVRKVRGAVSMRPEVEFVARGALYDHERSIKAKRVIDLRDEMD